MSNKNDERLGKFISLVLRHKPEEIGIKLDKNGWADIKELIDGMNTAGKKIDMETLERIVGQNNKNRYSFNDNKTKIRANQGHSINVDIELKEETPPEFLYHGTATIFLDAIKKQGLKPMSRLHVHLSDNIDTAIDVGSRHGKPAILKIKAKEMYERGFKFYLSENGVWLVDNVPSEYFTYEFYF